MGSETQAHNVTEWIITVQRLQGHPRSSIFVSSKARVQLYIFLLVVNSNLDPILHSFRYGGLNAENFPYPTPILAKIWGCSLCSRSVMISLRGKVRLINREIIFQEFQPRTTIPQRHRRTDRQTDGRTTCLGSTAHRYASRGKNVLHMG